MSIQQRSNRVIYAYDPAATALELAKGYARMIARHAGMTWDKGNDIEIEILVTAIIDAAKASS